MAEAITGSSLRDFKKDLFANFEHRSFKSAISGVDGSLLTSLAMDLIHINANCWLIAVRSGMNVLVYK